MTRFSANLGYLWTELALPDAIRAAAHAGFDAVECHWPFDTPAKDIRAVLAQTGLPMLALNTGRGGAQEFGLSALSRREQEARATIDRAVDYAAASGTKAVHVMAGIASGDVARDTFIANLRYACDRARLHDITILIEPLNVYDVPGYFLQTSGQALDIISQLNDSALKLLFDCYHLQIMEGNLRHRLQHCLPVIGHIQFASVPGRKDPSKGDINYRHLFAYIDTLGYDAPLGAEYNTGGKTEPTLGWMDW